MRVLSALAVLLAAPLAQAAPFTVVVDPGHGGAHDGAWSPRGVREKDIVLAVAKKLEALLAQEPGTRVVLTRTGDEDPALDQRTALANRVKADLFLSIHCNSMPTVRARRDSTGIETYSLSANATDAAANAVAALENADVGESGAPDAMDPVSMILDDLARTAAHADSTRLARFVQQELVRDLRAKDRGVRQAPFIVLLGAEMPAVLVEIGFISHPVEGRLLARAAYQDKVAAALRDGVRAFREQVYAAQAGPDGGVPAQASATPAPAGEHAAEAQPAAAPSTVPAAPKPATPAGAASPEVPGAVRRPEASAGSPTPAAPRR